MAAASDEVIILESKPSRFPSVFVVLRGSALSPCLIAIAIAFIAFGAAAWTESGKIHPTRVEYSNVNKYQYVTTPGSDRVNMGIRKFQDDAGIVHSQGSVARMLVNVLEPLDAPVYLYYTVTNFYQAMSFWHDGRSNEQLMGSLPVDSMLYRCDPFRQPGSLDGSAQTPISIDGRNTTIGAMLYYPCGVAAWSKFNDSFLLYRVVGNAFSLPVNPTDPLDTTQLTLICNTSDFDAKGNPLNRSVSPNLCSKQGIARPQDQKTRFGPVHHDPFSWTPRYPYATDNRYLQQGWYHREPGHEVPDPEDLDLQVWMASAATKNFRKLFRIINVPIPAGLYLLEVHEFYDTVGFRGSKGMILRSANSWLVEQHFPLAGCYLGIGCFAFVCSLAVGFNAFLNSRKDRREIAKQEAEDKAEMANVALASSTPISFIRASAKRMFNSFANFVGEEDHKKNELQRKRWYSFELNSPEMIEYLELRREREDIRKWQLENEGASSGDSSSGSESSDQDIEEIGSTSFSPAKAREETAEVGNNCIATVQSLTEERRGVNKQGVEMVEAEVDDSDEGEEVEVDEGEEEEPEERE